MSEGITAIDDIAFSGCRNLTSIVIPQSVTSIGSYAFAYCDSLLNVILPDGITDIRSDAFQDCADTLKLYCREGSFTAATLEAAGFTASYYDPEAAAEFTCEQVETEEGPALIITGYTGGTLMLEIPAQIDGLPVVAIGDGAFAALEELAGVVVPEGVVSIGDNAFAQCARLQSVSLPQSLERIGSAAFSGCALSDIALPESLRSLGDHALDVYKRQV